MATGIEAVFGWQASQFAAAAELLGIKLPVTDADWHQFENGEQDWFDFHGTPLTQFNAALRGAQRAVLEAEGYQFLRTSHEDRYMTFMTPWGEREFAPFRLTFYYDPHEMDDQPEEAVLGVCFSGRYFPSYLDAQRERGGLYPMRIDAEMLRKVQIARGHLAAVIPAFETASLSVIQRHY